MKITGWVRTHKTTVGEYGNAFLVAPTSDQSLTTYKQLAHEAKKLIPGLTEDDVFCGIVTESGMWLYRAVLRVPCEAHLKLDGFDNVEKLPFAVNC